MDVLGWTLLGLDACLVLGIILAILAAGAFQRARQRK